MSGPSPQPPRLPAFRPPLWLRDGRLQTLSTLLHRPFGRFPADGIERVFEVDDGDRVTGVFHGQPDRPEAAVLVLLHGLGGSIDSSYMVGTARAAHRAGLASLRVNARNCGGTAALSKGVHHGALWSDPLRVLRTLAEEVPGRPLHLAGFSLGAALALQVALQPKETLPPELASCCAVSPPLDLSACAAFLEATTFGRLAGRSFVRSLRGLVRERERHHGHQVDPRELAGVRTVREFDALVTAPLGGFSSLEAYYRAGSVAGRLAGLNVPTRLVHSLDDPLIPPEDPLRLAAAPPSGLDLHLVPRGGHVAFRGRRPAHGPHGPDLDRSWAESRVVDFALHLADRAPPP